MKRPREHVKEDISEQVLRSFLPLAWILRDIEPDYGIDKSLEIVEDDVVTGKEILLQLKGTETPQIHDGYISFGLSTANMKYYLERDLPVLLIVVDINDESCYWSFLQKYAFDVLNIEKPTWVDQKTITIRIPVEQKVNETLEQIVDIAKGGSAFILSRRISQIPSKYLTTWKSNTEAIISISKVADDFLDKSMQLRFEVSYRHDKEGDQEKSIKVLSEIFDSAFASNNKRIAIKAGLLIANQLNPHYQNEVVWGWLIRIKEMIEEVNDNSLNILWWGSLSETLYIKLIKDYNSLTTLTLVSSQSPNNIMTPFLVSEMYEKITQLYKVEMDFINYLNKAYVDGEYVIYVDFLRRLAKMHWVWVFTNSLKGNEAIIFEQLKSIRTMLLFTRKLSKVISEDIEFMILLDMTYLYHSMEEYSLRDSTFEEAYRLAEKLEHKGYLQELERVRQIIPKILTVPYLIKFDDSKVTREKPSFEQEDELIKTLLSDARIDIEKGTDDLAELARTGLKDRNPERVLKHCEYLYTEIITYGRIWDMVALPETGLKILYCDKKGSIMGHSLDELLDSFKKEKCKECQYQKPRPEEWKWTREWHRNRETPELMKRIIEKWFKH